LRVAEELYARFPQLPEGKLTRLRASVVREEALAEVAETFGLAKYVRLGEGELSSGAPRADPSSPTRSKPYSAQFFWTAGTKPPANPSCSRSARSWSA